MSASSVRAFRRHSERQFAVTAQFMPPHDPAEIEAFVADMSCFEGMSRHEMQNIVGDRPLPTGFIHVRTHDVTTGEEMAFALGSLTRPANARDLVCLADPDTPGWGHLDAWIATTAMPTTIPGVLDLAIHYRYKEDGKGATRSRGSVRPARSQRSQRVI